MLGDMLCHAKPKATYVRTYVRTYIHICVCRSYVFEEINTYIHTYVSHFYLSYHFPSSSPIGGDSQASLLIVLTLYSPPGLAESVMRLPSAWA